MDRKEKMDKITQMLKEGVESVFQSDNYRQFLVTMSRFPTYSLRNQLLLWQQTGGTATYVCGYKKWQTFNRHVCKNQKGLLIIAPNPIKLEAKSPDEEEQTIMHFRATYVYDISQTEGEDLPSLVHELTDNDASYDAIIEKLIDFAPVPVTFTSDLPEGVKGCFSPSESRIKVRETMCRADKVRNLVHEITHSFFDADPENKVDKMTREVRAESTAFTVCSALGIPTDLYSWGYIAGWSSSHEMKELQATMQDIRDMSTRIISAIQPQEIPA